MNGNQANFEYIVFYSKNNVMVLGIFAKIKEYFNESNFTQNVRIGKYYNRSILVEKNDLKVRFDVKINENLHGFNFSEIVIYLLWKVVITFGRRYILNQTNSAKNACEHSPTIFSVYSNGRLVHTITSRPFLEIFFRGVGPTFCRQKWFLNDICL